MFKLLLVDDELIIREGLQRMIDWERLGMTLTASCSNAIAALDSMMDDMPDILVTDVRMPGMNGLELVERAMALHPQLQSIILSGYDTFEYARQALKSGVCEYLLKPCSQEEMEEALKRACPLCGPPAQACPASFRRAPGADSWACQAPERASGKHARPDGKAGS